MKGTMGVPKCGWESGDGGGVFAGRDDRVGFVHTGMAARVLWAKGTSWTRAKREVAVAQSLSSPEFLAWLVVWTHSGRGEGVRRV